ncbi:MAG TPA: hypothetical protein VN937_23230 [Blastocatellia bacterium]|nr:hypothetical protein [Blastocatellia bacterium]
MAERTNLATQPGFQDTTVDRSAFAIRQDIAAKRESISETVDKLGDRLQQTFDWHEYVAAYPVVALGLAAGAGFLIAGAFKRKPTPQERIHEAVAELTEDLADRVGGVMAGVIQKKMFSGGAVKAAATTILAKVAVDFLKSRPGGAMAGDNSRPGQPQSRYSAPRNSDMNVQPGSFSTTGSRG